MLDKILLKLERDKIETALRAEVAALDPIISPLAAHIFDAGGKRLRPLLAVTCAKAFGYTADNIYPLACSVELLHAATLLHDDILDGAKTRRGQAASHTIFGTDTAILSGDVMLATTMLILARYNDIAFINSVAEAAAKTAAGEVKEIQNMRNPELSYADYLDIITGKTAWLARCSCEIGALLAAATPQQREAVAGYGLNLGIAFQIVDDALDLAPESETGKPTGGDLREGKMTPPLFFYLESLDEKDKKEFKQKFANSSLDETELNKIIAAMHDQGCISRTRKMADEHLQKAQNFLSELPENKYKNILLQLTHYVQQRNH